MSRYCGPIARTWAMVIEQLGWLITFASMLMPLMVIKTMEVFAKALPLFFGNGWKVTISGGKLFPTVSHWTSFSHAWILSAVEGASHLSFAMLISFWMSFCRILRSSRYGSSFVTYMEDCWRCWVFSSWVVLSVSIYALWKSKLVKIILLSLLLLVGYGVPNKEELETCSIPICCVLCIMHY